MAGKGLWNNVLFWNNDILSGLPYKVLSCMRIKQILIKEFYPIMFRVLETLNWLAMFLLSMQKHALLMLENKR